MLYAYYFLPKTVVIIISKAIVKLSIYKSGDNFFYYATLFEDNITTARDAFEAD